MDKPGFLRTAEEMITARSTPPPTPTEVCGRRDPEHPETPACTLLAAERGQWGWHTPPSPNDWHNWMYCQSEDSYYEGDHRCDLLSGHEGNHRFTLEWD